MYQRVQFRQLVKYVIMSATGRACMIQYQTSHAIADDPVAGGVRNEVVGIGYEFASL